MKDNSVNLIMDLFNDLFPDTIAMPPVSVKHLKKDSILIFILSKLFM